MYKILLSWFIKFNIPTLNFVNHFGACVSELKIKFMVLNTYFSDGDSTSLFYWILLISRISLNQTNFLTYFI